jgi:two-component system, OmpR family, sensor histidine kinase TctE
MAGLVVPIVLFIAVDTVSLYRSALGSAHKAYDRQLVAAAHSIGDMLRLERGRLQLSVPYAVLELNRPDAGSAMIYRVSGLGGELLWGDPDLPRYAGDIPRDSPYSGLVGVYDETVHGQAVRVAVLYQPIDSEERSGLILIQVAEPMLNREEMARDILQRTLMMQSLLVLGLVAVIVLVVGHALKPLGTLRRELDQRDGADLSPLIGPAAPSELQPVIDALNQLMDRLRRLLGQQQRFVADAAHQLRTPLAVLNTQLQSGLNGDVAPAMLMQEMQGTVRRATALSNHMLSLAKVEQLRDRGEVEACNIHEAAHEAALELSPLVSAKDLDFELLAEAQGPQAQVLAHPWLVGELIRNLVNNAIRHTPHGASLGIVVSSDDEWVSLEVWDSGPGIPAELRERVFEPFAAACPPSGGAGGSGLGLAICRAIVVSLKGRIELADHRAGTPAPGLRATVRLPKLRA